MMSKLGVLLTICLLLFPLTAVQLDGDQPADLPELRAQDFAPERSPWFDPVRRCCSQDCRVCIPCCPN
uniref:Conotoxin TsMMSK-B021 n=1 Tax=Conus tessulatus TaxID=101317 RepID=M231_CONTS|nr:RecName: Full=Conotoxin TsMMSK-B021; Flags: Precursor [Conus tessulatus]AAG60362.1 conotoxin scaffold III/IV precursor [Conus tessulatus]